MYTLRASRVSCHLTTSLSPLTPIRFRTYALLRTMATNAEGKYNWIVIVPDKPGTVAKRLEIRGQHLAGVKQHETSGLVKLGGESAPLLKTLAHSLFVVLLIPAQTLPTRMLSRAEDAPLPMDAMTKRQGEALTAGQAPSSASLRRATTPASGPSPAARSTWWPRQGKRSWSCCGTTSIPPPACGTLTT